MIFWLLSCCKGSKFLTRQYCRVIFRESYDVRTNPIVGNLVHWYRALLDAAGHWQHALSPIGGPRLEQVPSVLISKISGEEIENTKTRLLSGTPSPNAW
jgi:hypothetical protein